MEENGNKYNNEHMLHEFRSQWHQEIKGNQQQNHGESSISADEELKQAETLFLQGVDLERKGKCFEATRLYRRAVQLVPDIEFKIYQLSQQQQKLDDSLNNNNKTSKTSSFKSEGNSNFDEEVDNIIESFQHDLSLNANNRICETSYAPGVLSTSIHISCLPVEVFLTILKWLVSNDLDVRSLERFGQVCKGFLLLSRDSEIWRLACIKVWGSNVTTPSVKSSWREMFISRPRVNFNGCYISRITYQRLGESSFQDQFYRPVQIVEYFRLIRFLPNGQLIMMTSADDLQTSINRLKNGFQSKEILRGNYRYQDNLLFIVIRKNQVSQKFQKRKNNVADPNGFTFFLELEIQDTSKRKFSKLMWKHYSVSQFKTEQEELTSEFDLRSATKYPPFFFSVVKSFHYESSECLKV